VKVCPTGIDIRNGTQLECVNCTACIDACDAIMTKFNFDQGLIRYASENNIAKNEKLRFTSRIAAYTGVLSLLILVLSVLLITRQDIDATVMRAKGTLYQEQSNGSISNLYNIKLINKTRKNLPVVLKIEGEKKGVIRMVGNDLNVASESVGEGIFFVDIAQDQLSGRKNKIEIGVYSYDKRVELVKTTFFAPNI
jgi:polyferredoxin